MIKENVFWNEQTQNSKMKSLLVEQYFKTWASILLAKGKIKTIQYVDLFCGKGTYDDGTESTPIKIINIVANDPKFSQSIKLYFNDKDSEAIANLESNISEETYEKLKYKPKFFVEDVSCELVKKIDIDLPLFLFFDPYGYKGLSLELLNHLLSGYGSDGMIFFNYNRINPGTCNDSVEEHINKIFTQERADIIRKEFANYDVTTPTSRMDMIINHFTDALKDIDLKYSVLCKFYMGNRNKVSHYIVGISKHPDGYAQMKKIISKATDYKDTKDGFGTFEFNKTSVVSDYIDLKSNFKEELCEYFAGKSMVIEEIYEKHNVGRNYYLENYKRALKELEEEQKIIVDPMKSDCKTKRRAHTFTNGTVITFK